LKSNHQHQKDAISTDKANLTDDQHIHEEDKQHLKASDQAERADNPGQRSNIPAPESVKRGKS
jgi:hypothetical protein